MSRIMSVNGVKISMIMCISTVFCAAARGTAGRWIAGQRTGIASPLVNVPAMLASAWFSSRNKETKSSTYAL
jgi:hypothetical protein